MKVAIAQPTYLPWLGYFDLIDQVDAFVLLDTVQFSKQSWQQRNRIKSPQGLQWLTVPVILRGRFGQAIKDVEIREPDFWRDHLRAIELSYRRTEFFEHYFDPLRARLELGSGTLAALNVRMIEFLMGQLGIPTRLLLASELNGQGRRTELLANLCGALGAQQYISPPGSAAYLLTEKELLLSRDVEVLFQQYEHPLYRQRFPPFCPQASVLDLLFNEGPMALEIIRSGRRHPLLPGQMAHPPAEAS